MAVPLLEVEGLTKSFGGLRAVNDIRFRMEQKEVIGLIGPNGAGKTTLLRLLTGILKPDSGSIRFKGKELVGMKPGTSSTWALPAPFKTCDLFADCRSLPMSWSRACLPVP